MGMLGHDLRTPLQVILQSTRVLSKASGDQQQQAILLIDRSTHNIKKMVEDLLDVARTRLVASMPLELQPTDAAMVCRQLIEDLRAVYPIETFVMKRTVHNFGEPIPPAILPRIFEPMVRANGGTEMRAQSDSMGLGLYIASIIAKAHAGTLSGGSLISRA